MVLAIMEEGICQDPPTQNILYTNASPILIREGRIRVVLLERFIPLIPYIASVRAPTKVIEQIKF